MSSTDIGLEDTTPLDPEARARVDSFRLQKGRERIAELEARITELEGSLHEAGGEIGAMALEWGQDKKRIEELERLVKQLEDALLDRHAHASVRVAAALELLRAR